MLGSRRILGSHEGAPAMIPMTRMLTSCATVLALVFTRAAAQDTGAPPKPSTSPSPFASPPGTLATPKRPLSALPYTPSLDVTSMDRSVDPCVDFYQYSLRRLDQEEPDPGRPGALERLRQARPTTTSSYLWGILEEAARSPTRRPRRRHSRRSATTSPPAWTRPRSRRPVPRRSSATSTRIAGAAIQGRSWPRCSAASTSTCDSAGMLFGFGSEQDFEDSDAGDRASPARAASGLPDRDYYVKDDDKSQEIRASATWRTSQKILELLGDPPEARGADAADGDARSRPRWPRPRSPASSAAIRTRSTTRWAAQSCRRSRRRFRWDDYLAGLGPAGARRRST